MEVVPVLDLSRRDEQITEDGFFMYRENPHHA